MLAIFLHIPTLAAVCQHIDMVLRESRVVVIGNQYPLAPKIVVVVPVLGMELLALKLFQPFNDGIGRSAQATADGRLFGAGYP